MEDSDGGWIVQGEVKYAGWSGRRRRERVFEAVMESLVDKHEV